MSVTSGTSRRAAERGQALISSILAAPIELRLSEIAHFI
jgi:hypothetical protein